MSIQSISFHFCPADSPQKLFQTILGYVWETFSCLFTIGLSQICLWISITVKWIFCEAASTEPGNYLLIR